MGVNRRDFLLSATLAAGAAPLAGWAGMFGGKSRNLPQSLNRGIIINSAQEECRDVKVVRLPSRSQWEFSGISDGKTAEIGFSPADLLDEKAVVSWTAGRKPYRVHLLLPKADISGSASLTYQLLPDGRATVYVASLSGLRRNLNKNTMVQRTTVDNVLKFAIAEEEKSEKFYTRLSIRMKTPETREALLRFAGEERKHRDWLMGIRAGGPVVGSGGEEVTNLQISDYTVDVTPTPDMQYPDALLLAIKQERAAYSLYTALAALADAVETKSMFHALAQEEVEHEQLFKNEMLLHLG